jgi:hypothetical protein
MLDDTCPECNEVNGHLECCMFWLPAMTKSNAIEHSRFLDNCYCLTTLRSIDIIDPEPTTSDSIKQKIETKKKQESSKLLSDRDRVKRFQKERSHIYRKPTRD